jgi:hypothetical protein
MYVPQEGLNLSVEDASKDKDLVRRLEGKVHLHILITFVDDLITYMCNFVLVQKLCKQVATI